ncbi:MAG: hypothetical protein QXX38_03605 [Candidatus Aenigmatarchaeota archaeon]
MIEKEKIEEIKKEVEKEFPGDIALQQIHIARKILSEEAKQKGLSFLEYIKEQMKELENFKHDKNSFSLKSQLPK